MYSIKNKQLVTKTSNSQQKMIWSLGIVALMVAAIVLLELTNTTHFFHKRKAVSSTIKSTAAKPGNAANSDKVTGTSNNSTAPLPDSQSKDKAPTVSNSAGPITPYGNFVSNHSPGESGSPTTEQSVCITTPGASCTITFTQGKVIKTLSSTVTDGTGSAYWSWNVKPDFTAGDWKITATATLNGQSKTAQDQIPLKVQ